MTKKEVLFCTSNKEKLRDLQYILGDEFDLKNDPVELTEIQGNPEEITRAKSKEAYKLLKRPLITEDTCLCFNAFKGLPGPYIKHFLLNVGPLGVYNLLSEFEDKSGYSLCTFGYVDENGVKLFQGRTDGTIVRPRGYVDVSWNSIFQPQGHDKTFAELTFEEKNKVSHRYKAGVKLKEFLLNNSK
ncbi:Inosine triphosphate pyrophosphatase [Theileria parva strain Muguga]|uniref:Inosine triphosphate pyrophosphatase n=1 Tax=Theileria parva strain Muguga TaxID=333668 RepID=UPI001C622396|nr:Inosine triphosphate pyrophosphatase [Theileria parva strain Muguga]EAN30536.2 Inosine triphosphate pyrophosphatase [Theileria parva strain Muguga]